MNLTKKNKEDVLKRYDTWLHSYLNGDILNYERFFAEDYHLMGSTNNEEFLNRKDATNFFKKTAERLAGKTDLRNETKTIECFDQLMCITHALEAWFLKNDDWAYYGRFRFSSIMQKKEHHWKFIYQHFSTTDCKTDEGETIGFAKVNLENQELREAIKRSTIKLEEKNRELEIESALEKVRSRTMAMQHSDELQEASFLLDQQVRALGVKTWGCAFNIYGEKESTEWFGNEAGVLPTYTVPRTGIFKDYYQKGQKGETLIIKEFSGKACVDHYEYMSSLPVIGDVLKNLKTTNRGFPTYQIDHVVYFKYGYLLFITKEHVPEAHDIFKRFAKVFEQTYTRFLDLQKAEAQTREAQIEMALEKVRSRTMAMQNSSELPEAANNLFLQVQDLGIPAWSAGYCIWEEKDKKSTWCNMSSEGEIQKGFSLPTIGEGYNFYEPLKNKEPFHVAELGDKALVMHYEFMKTLPGIGEVLEDFDKKGIALPTFQIFHIVYFTHGYLMFITYEPVLKDWDIFKRFGKVFQQTYTRFQDLQKSEAQTREAQIEAALERVRSRSMAMHSSEELLEVISVVSEQLQQLDFKFVHVSFLNNDNSQDYKFWTAAMGLSQPMRFTTPNVDIAVFNNLREAQKQSLSFLTDIITKKEHIKWHKHLLKHGGSDVFSKADNEFIMSRGMARSIAINPNITLILANYASIPYSEADNKIIQRFGQVFEQTYTRFLDLKNAESQTRDAQINLAVERVRAKALAMHKSEEIMEVVAKLKDEVMALDIPDVIAATIFLKEGDDNVRMWDLSTLEKDNNGYQIPFDITFKLKKKDPNLYVKRIWENPENYFLEVQDTKDLKRIIAWLRENNKDAIANEVEDYTKTTKLERLHHAVKKLNNGKLVIDLLNPPCEEMEVILTKMGAAFDLAYKRFEDLQNSEAQVREAKIEASLEKVRTVALSLKKSDDMLDIAQVLYEQLLVLGFTDMRNAIIDIHNDDNETFLDYDYSHDMSSAITLFSYHGDPVIEQQIKKVQSSNDAFFEIELKGEELKDLIKTRLENGEKDDPRLHTIDHLTYNLYSFGNGAIGISNFGILSDDQKKVLKRFRNVFTFAYKRYTDLAKAEAQAMEARIEAALEKVRSVALSLNKSEDMLEVSQVLYEQLLALGFANVRNSIIDIDNGDGLTFLDYDYSHEMGGTVTLMSYKDDPTLKEQLEDIIETTDGSSEMILEGQKLQDLINMRRNNGEADDPRLSKTKSLSYILYAFGKGAIGISNFGVLNENQKSILGRFRNVFTFAYQRYTDLAQSEAQATALLAEKERLEKILSDLQATQKQLIQSEKMASLGELTAGIAHEIQNPLNFVNNFSEVSKELLDEMREEMENGDMEEVRAIMGDVIQNLEKINHHGKRADGIVKGMLQHSRTSASQSEPTDINALADEYFRLAYHGLRAKDKSFNAHLVTEYDERIKTVHVIPQDIGRVILNLFTNAFYAVDERSRISIDEKSDLIQENLTGLKSYKPTVLVRTKKLKDKIVIKVKDNGNGIPKHIVDKIFQPFFTTKPAGKGTGLGLSMSYDIIKAHNGELKVETKEREGTTFTIQLPMAASTT